MQAGLLEGVRCFDPWSYDARYNFEGRFGQHFRNTGNFKKNKRKTHSKIVFFNICFSHIFLFFRFCFKQRDLPGGRNGGARRDELETGLCQIICSFGNG